MARSEAGRGADQFPLRLPEGMRERIKAFADRKGLSMNTVIVDVLAEKFPPPPPDEGLAEMQRAANIWLTLFRVMPATTIEQMTTPLDKGREGSILAKAIRLALLTNPEHRPLASSNTGKTLLSQLDEVISRQESLDAAAGGKGK